MSSRRVVDLRKKRPGAHARAGMRPLSFREGPPRRSTLRARRRRFRAILVLGVLAVFALAAYGASYASYLPQLSVQGVVIEGVKDMRPALVRARAEKELYGAPSGFFSGTNIFLYPRAEIETALEEYFPRVRHAEVSRESLLATVVIATIEERNMFARWCTTVGSAFTDERTETCYAMDESGFIFASAGSTDRFATAYTFRGDLATSSAPIGQAYLPGRFAGVLVFLERLGQAGYSPLEISVENREDFSVQLARGFTVSATFGSDVGTLIKNLELVLSSDALLGKEGELEYIDLRFGNRVYYKLFSEGESTFGGSGEDEQSAQ